MFPQRTQHLVKLLGWERILTELEHQTMFWDKPDVSLGFSSWWGSKQTGMVGVGERENAGWHSRLRWDKCFLLPCPIEHLGAFSCSFHASSASSKELPGATALFDHLWPFTRPDETTRLYTWFQTIPSHSWNILKVCFTPQSDFKFL